MIEVVSNKTYKLIDKDRFINSSISNHPLYKEHFNEDDTIVFDEVDLYGGWCDFECVVASDEFHLLEEVV